VEQARGRAYRSAGARRSFDHLQAERWLEAGLKAAGLAPGELKASRGSDPRKVALATFLWEQTTVSQNWLAERLRMGSPANVSQQIRRAKRGSGKIPRGLQRFLDQAVKT
jgi:hypothetical protein